MAVVTTPDTEIVYVNGDDTRVIPGGQRRTALTVRVTGPQGTPGIPIPLAEDGEDSWVPGPPGNVGPKGAQGVPGPTAGTIPPATGEDGDDSWQPGPQGVRGLQGLQGLPGQSNVPGPPGDDGDEAFLTPAPQGFRGATGVAGAQGPVYVTYPEEPDDVFPPPGAQGIQGPPGTSGASGSPAYYMVSALTAPVVGNFTADNGAVNDGGNTLGFQIFNNSSGSSDNLQGMLKSVPGGGSWNVDLGFVSPVPVVNYTRSGLMLYDSAGGKAITISLGPSPNTAIQIDQWSNRTTYSTTPNSWALWSPLLFVRINYDGTNYNFYVSFDNYSWGFMKQIGKTAWLANVADKIGPFINPHIDSGLGGTTAANFIHYREH